MLVVRVIPVEYQKLDAVHDQCLGPALIVCYTDQQTHQSLKKLGVVQSQINLNDRSLDIKSRVLHKDNLLQKWRQGHAYVAMHM